MKMPDSAAPAAAPQLVGIQSLRGIAAIMVMLHHAFYWEGKNFSSKIVPFYDIGESGVDIFFVISGFIMMYITPRAFRSWRDQSAFLVRRFTRIYPPYWAVVIPILLLSLARPKQVDGGHFHFLSSFFLLPDRFEPALFVAWTLVFELFFYVVASFIFYREGISRLWATLAWFGLIAAATCLHPSMIQNVWLHVWLSPLSLEFISGMLLAHGLQNGSLPIKNWLAALTVLIAWSWAVFFGMRHGSYIGDHESPARVFVYGVPAFLIVWMVLQMELQNEWRWIAKLSVLGDRSYSAYLLHAPILAGLLPLAARLVPHADWLEAFLITAGAILFLALPIELCYRFVEKPSHAWGKYLASLLRSRRPVQLSS